jgi:hypothetical protein
MLTADTAMLSLFAISYNTMRLGLEARVEFGNP